MEKITFCIPSKNNKRYLEACIPSIRKNSYRGDHDIIVFVDADNDGTVEWLESVKDEYNLKYIVNDTGKLYGIGKAYDKCVEESTTDIFMIFHADMMLGRDADLEAFKYLDRKKVVCATRIEPPLHPDGPEKIVKDFLEMGGHDPRFASAREDSDVFNRLVLSGFDLIQSWQSFVYHLTARAGQFQHGKLTQDHSQKSEEWRNLMNNSTREFFRKWGSTVNHDQYMMPIISPKYDIGFVVKNCNEHMLGILEPWCSTIYVDCEIEKYIESEQPNTTDNLTKKILSIHSEKQNDIVVSFDGLKLTNEEFQFIQQLPLVIKDSGEIGNMEYSIFEIQINKLKTYEGDLIKCHMM